MLRVCLCHLAVSILMVLIPLDIAFCADNGIETISIFADEASEDIQPGILHFKGHFTMQTQDWKLESTLATVHGEPEKPDKVHLEGSPARFLIYQDNQGAMNVVEATAPRMVYQRSTNILRLSGGALLKLDDELVRSEVIEYNIETERYLAGGEDGVLIQVPARD